MSELTRGFRGDRQETTIRTATLTLDDVALDYRDQGDGPPLLLLPGGTGQAAMLDGLAAHLAEHHRVVALSSRVASAAPGTIGTDQRPEDHARDALRAIETLFDEPPVVFGFSAGAITTLELLARHPERVGLGVVHEPPVLGLLPDPGTHRDALEAVRSAARDGDPDEAARLMTDTMTATETVVAQPALRHPGEWLEGYGETDPEPPTPQLLEVLAQAADLQQLFLEHVLVPFTTTEVDVPALAAAGSRLVCAAGIDSRGQLAHRAASGLAIALGHVLVEFPGGHLGPVERPTQVAHALRALLAQR
ncbi:alpha/beta hydrolase [Saccharopolyspora tripterygii]